MTNRDNLPAALRRRLLIEAGHRCAIPTCRVASPLQFEHIIEWATVKRHDFENMIVLCANCHGRKGTKPGQIDRKSLQQYKANLAVINSRYSDLERRVLEVFAEQRQQLAPGFLENLDHLADDWPRGIAIQLPGTLRLMMMYLLKDGYVEIAPPNTVYVSFHGTESYLMRSQLPLSGPVPDVEYYRLTAAGLEFLDAWTGARPLDGDDDPAVNDQEDAA